MTQAINPISPLSGSQKTPVQLLVDSLGSDNPQTRHDASLKLSEEKDRISVIESLIQCLDGSDLTKASCALWVLGSIKATEATSHLVKASTNPDGRFRRYGSWAIGQLVGSKTNTPEVEEALLVCLKDEDPEIREDAAFALSELGKEEAIDGLIECLSNEDVEVKHDAILELGNVALKCKTDSSIVKIRDVLISILKGDKDYEAAWRAACSLGLIKDRKEVFGCLITKGLTDGDPQVRLYTFDILTNTQAAQTVPILACALNDPSQDVKKFAKERFKTLNDDVVGEGINAWLKAIPIQTLPTVLQALGNTGDPRVVPFIVRFVVDKTKGPIIPLFAQQVLVQMERETLRPLETTDPLMMYLPLPIKLREPNPLIRGLELCLNDSNEAVRDWATGKISRAKLFPGEFGKKSSLVL